MNAKVALRRKIPIKVKIKKNQLSKRLANKVKVAILKGNKLKM